MQTDRKYITTTTLLGADLCHIKETELTIPKQKGIWKYEGQSPILDASGYYLVVTWSSPLERE